MYRKIDPRIWNDRKVAGLDETAKLVFLFLLTHQNVTCLGAMRANSAGLSREIGMDPRRFRRALEQLAALSMLEVNPKLSFISFPNWLKYNGPEGPNSVIKGWIAALNLLPDCPERDRLISRSASYLCRCSEPFRRIAITPEIVEAFDLDPEMASRMPSPKASDMPCPIQKQKQEQKQEQNTSSCSEGLSPPALPSATDPAEQFELVAPPPRKRRERKPTTEGTGQVVAIMPLVGDREAQVTDDYVAELVKAYPAVDTSQALAEIRVWLLSNPTRRPTASGIGRFINAWLKRAQNDGGTRSRRDSPPAVGRRDRSGAPLPPPKKTAIQARVIDGVFYNEEYDVATGQPIRRWPRDAPKKPQEEKP